MDVIIFGRRKKEEDKKGIKLLNAKKVSMEFAIEN